jgi:hypothetical protein
MIRRNSGHPEVKRFTVRPRACLETTLRSLLLIVLMTTWPLTVFARGTLADYQRAATVLVGDASRLVLNPMVLPSWAPDVDLLVVPNQGHGVAGHHYVWRRRWDFVRHVLNVEPPPNFKMPDDSQ